MSTHEKIHYSIEKRKYVSLKSNNLQTKIHLNTRLDESIIYTTTLIKIGMSAYTNTTKIAHGVSGEWFQLFGEIFPVKKILNKWCWKIMASENKMNCFRYRFNARIWVVVAKIKYDMQWGQCVAMHVIIWVRRLKLKLRNIYSAVLFEKFWK